MTSLHQELIEQIEHLLDTRLDYTLAETQARAMLCEESATLDAEYHVRVLCALSKALRNLGQTQEGLSIAETALELATQEGSQHLRARALACLGAAHQFRSEFDEAIEIYEKAIRLYEDLQDDKECARLLNLIGLAFFSQFKYRTSLEYFESSLHAFEKLDARHSIADVAVNIGNVHTSLSEYVAARSYYERAQALYEELDSNIDLAVVHMSLGSNYWNLSDFAKALEYYARALKAYEEAEQKRGMANVTSNIGVVYWNLQDYNRALAYMGKAVQLYEELDDVSSIAMVSGNMGTVYNTLLDGERALEYTSKALDLHKQLGNKFGIAKDTGNIGVVLLQHSTNYAKALECLRESLQLFEELGDKSGIANATADIGVLYAKENFEGFDPMQAEEYLLRAIAIFREIGAKAQLITSYKTLADVYKRERRWEDFAEFFQKFYETEKEVLNEDAKNKASQLDYERRQREEEMKRMVAKAEADAELRGTQNLLHRVLPQSIAERLLRGERVADYFPQVSILFADIVGFTPIAARMPAKAVLAFLNYVFGEFDRIMKAHGCQKIKTIGDGYMAVCGAPIECPDHAERLSRAALELKSGIELPDDIRKFLPADSVFHLRIGLHTGSAFAGVVGEEGFTYDIYSDAVNLAARMESHGQAGKIHCSTDFAMHLQNRDDSFVLTERGEIEVKGKGTMRTYFLESMS